MGYSDTLADPVNATPMPQTQFDVQEYDVTDSGCQTCLCLTCPFHCLVFAPGLMGKKTMTLESEEAVLNINCQPFCNIDTRRPYGELGSVDQHHCFCCTGVSSGLTGNMPIYIGSGCETERVVQIVAELKKRMKARGDTGQIKRTEMTLQEVQALRSEVAELKGDMKLILRALNVPETQSMADRM